MLPYPVAQTSFDVLIIGGGPGGAAAASFIARGGKRALVLEREHFPRFHIGESLLPYNRRLFEQMGVLGEIEAAGFPVKFGAQFQIGDASKSLKLKFQNGRFTRLTTAFQVERARFDHILLKHACKSGAEVREGWTVTQFSNDSSGVTLQGRENDTGQTHSFCGALLIDASGRGNVIGNLQGLRIVHPQLKTVAVFGHFEGVRLDPGAESTDTVIIRLENKWFWVIPISAAKVSVGCVLDQDELANAKLAP